MVNNKTNKVRNYGSDKPSTITPPGICAGVFEYQMSRGMADEILKSGSKTMTPQEVLCDYVNTQCGLKGYCVKVIVEL